PGSRKLFIDDFWEQLFPMSEQPPREDAIRSTPASQAALLRLAGLELRIVDNSQNISERIAPLTDQHPAAYVLHRFHRRCSQLNQSLVSRLRVLHPQYATPAAARFVSAFGAGTSPRSYPPTLYPT